ncbi:hypothetical protein SAMN04488063_2305 [Halopelagius inordinatus]|uniref:DUF7993 domain-containing protein n=1 Tax=Halopelagius inordinatus TaxID=553467 RepID=A0A1I2SQQ5_9EURY|nr:hypothetical protein [Halopelagius inordinatus]SFG52486.1 hypothetical protein SAMN04488063_2305 [Halopelagius inordinatus]
MVEDRLTDGKRIAQFVASEVEGHADLRLCVADADPDVEPTADGAFAYRIASEDEETVAEVYVQSDRARVEFVDAVEAAAEAADAEGLRVRPKAVRPPRTLVFVEDGAQVKWLLAALRAVSEESA